MRTCTLIFLVWGSPLVRAEAAPNILGNNSNSNALKNATSALDNITLSIPGSFGGGLNSSLGTMSTSVTPNKTMPWNQVASTAGHGAETPAMSESNVSPDVTSSSNIIDKLNTTEPLVPFVHREDTEPKLKLPESNNRDDAMTVNEKGPGTSALVVTYEAEDCTSMEKADLDTDADGYSGLGYIDYDDDGYIEWNNVTAFMGPGEYSLSIRYAVGDDGRACRLFVNDMRYELLLLPFKDTGGYGNWRYENVTVVLQEGSNTIGIQARAKGPHIDKMDVAPLSLHPLSSSTGSLNVPDPIIYSPQGTTQMINISYPVQIQLFWEKGMRWQGKKSRKSYCIQCVDDCKRDKHLKIERCDPKQKRQKWLFGGSKIMSNVDDNLCITRGEKYVKLKTCSTSRNDVQLWTPPRDDGMRFHLRPLHHSFRDKLKADCLTQQHHPKSSEELYMDDCREAEYNDKGIYDDTSSWVIGTSFKGHRRAVRGR